METHTPNPAERLIILMEERRPALGADPLRLLFWDLLMCLVRLLACHAEWGPQQQACRDGAGAEPGRIGAPAGFDVVAGDGGADCRGAAGGSGARGPVAVSAAVAAAGGTLVIDGTIEDDCIADAGTVRAARERPHPAAIARPSLFWRTDLGFGRFDSKNWVRADARNCVHFVTI